MTELKTFDREPTPEELELWKVSRKYAVAPKGMSFPYKGLCKAMLDHRPDLIPKQTDIYVCRECGQVGRLRDWMYSPIPAPCHKDKVVRRSFS